MVEKIKKFLQLWTEVLTIPAAIILWQLSPWILHTLDPVAATFDAGVLQKIIYAIIAMLVFNGMTWLGIKFNFPVLFEYYAKDAGEDFKNLEKWKKVKLLVSLYVALLFAFCLLLLSL